MSKTQQNVYRRAVGFIGSNRFFWIIVAMLVVQAAWIAASGRYPMAFDEDFHLGIIRLYTQHLSPFWDAQPAHADAFGAVYRDPSYLFHYLMSFPYRLLGHFTSSDTIQIMGLRALNIGFFAAGLVIYRRLLLRTKTSPAMVNAVLLLFVLIPVVPLLAAQVNYDNLFMPLVGLSLLLTLRFDGELSQRKRINFQVLGCLLVLLLLTSLIKYAFLPVFVAIAFYITVRIWRSFSSFRDFRTACKTGLKRISAATGMLLVVLLLVSGVLFGERYGVNLARYHTPVPDCDKVLTIKECSKYPPWQRDYNHQLHKDPHATKSPAVYAADWFYGMWLRLFFAVDGPATKFETRGPLLLPGIGAIFFAVTGVIAATIYGRRLFGLYAARVLALMLITSAFYIAALWLNGYRSFVTTGQSVGINGRYLVPFLPFLLLFCALALNEALRRRENLKLAVAGVALVCMLWGGGALTYVLRSNDRWYWPHTPLKGANSAIRAYAGPLVPGYRNPTQFMGRN